MSVNPDYLCPISGDLMLDPVMTASGQNYERKNIETWFETGSLKDPISGSVLPSRRLIPNHMLRNLILNSVDPVLIEQRRQMDHVNVNVNLSLPKIKTDWIPSTLGKKRLLFVAVIDISGSMASSSIDNSNREGSEFSRLDLIKHSLNTTVGMLSENDAIIIITFSDSAVILKNLTYIILDSDRSSITSSINSMKPTSSTNLYAGIKLGLQEAAKHKQLFDLVKVVVLTDGEPTSSYNPPYGIQKTIKTEYNNIAAENMSVNTIAYGYGSALESNLLYNIANDCKGLYAYVPDGGEVASVFVHLVSNMLHKKNTTIDLESHDMFVFALDLAITNAKTNYIKEASDVMTRCLNSLKLKQDQYSKDLCTDILHRDTNKGQIMKGLSSEFWSKWGQHYLPAVLSAHKNKQCMNFKDESMQHYNTLELKSIIEQGLVIFGLITPPEASCLTRAQQISQQSGSFQQTPMYNLSQTSDCFSAGTLVLKNVNAYKKVSEIKKGDQIMTIDGPATVLCVIKEPMRHKFVKLSNDAYVTPWHPVIVDTDWIFPENLNVLEENIYVHENVAYNFLLDHGHVIYLKNTNGLSDIQAVTLGHGLNNNEVTKHQFFDNYSKVLASLKKVSKSGLENGLVLVNGAKRSVVNGNVLEFI